MSDRAKQLLAGPRGRRLCAELVDAAVSLELLGATGGRPEQPAARELLAGAVDAADLPGLAEDAQTLHEALVGSVDRAMYWQPPDHADAALADPAVAQLLHPVAEAVAASPAAQWWWAPVDATAQHTLALTDVPGAATPVLTGAAAALQEWRQHTVTAERRAARERPVDPTAPLTGEWWSTPVPFGVPATSRALPSQPRTGAGIQQPVPTPVGLTLVEDELGWQHARSWPLRSSSARVYEVTGPGDWVDVVRRHPLEVTWSRRHDWYRVSGRTGTWVVPDWAAIAAEHDAVHLTVAGYLATAGRSLPVPETGAATVLAGWDPDRTWWLGDVLTVAGGPTDWVRDPERVWQPV